MEGQEQLEALRRRYWLERGGGIALLFLALLLYVVVADERLSRLYLGLGAGLIALLWGLLDNWITARYQRRKRAAKSESAKVADPAR